MRLSCQAINISSFRVLSGGWRLFSCRLHFKVGLRMMVAGCDPISCPQLIRSRYHPPPPSCTTHLLPLCSGEDDIKIWGTSWQQGHSPRRVLAQSIIVITIRNDGEQALFLDKVNRRWNKYWCGTVFISLHFISLQLCCLLYWNKSFWRISINVLKIHD